MSQPVGPTDSRIVMAEQSSHDVVNHTLSGGEPSPSDVPASTTDKRTAGGDEGEINNTATTQIDMKSKIQLSNENPGILETSLENGDKGKNIEHTFGDTSKHGPGSLATRALEMNGVASASDGGDDTASQGGSESDVSRTESRLHSRAGSAKRPTSFKPVSFAKFSVPKAPGTPTSTKVSEKAPLSSATSLSTTLQNPRPRLVAKTTSLRDSLSKPGGGAGKFGGGGPDPNQVWNKNRPAQQTPPKHLTDEELKQQYGIHMTSRIREDGGGTEAKWADIDDDEDDWAPETIEWTDGTKTDLTQPEPTPPPVHDMRAPTEIKEDFPPVEQVSAMKDPPKFIPKPVTSIGPNPTVLRLGANAERQARSAIISKGAGDKPPSSSTSPAPPPAKSPWAPLPPVERASPVMPPVQVHPQPRAPVREPAMSEGFNGPLPPKEIAADDFNRTWSEMQSGTRELYNSRSGRYEPVPESRKGTWRNEQSFRAPSVLQRPTVQGEQAGPAEPSPAFQTHRSSGQDGMHWTRRRTSSNVSGGSGSFGRRMSIGRPEAAQRSFEGRRGSLANGLVEPPIQAREPPLKDIAPRDISPAGRGPGPSWPPRGMTNGPETATNITSSSEQPHVPNEQATVAQPPQEDPVVMQERIMKEKRLEARQRRLEQEEKEEAAKRERIRQKLEALGPAPEKPKAKTRESQEPHRSEPKTSPTTAFASQSPPKPPVPEPTGEPKQYGMMKVHHPDNVKKLVEKERAAEKSTSMANTRRTASPAREQKPDGPMMNGFQQSNESPPQGGDKLTDQSLDEQGPQWRGNLNVSNSYSPWSANNKLVGTSTSISNPWKPLSNDKTLGNGIFDQALGGFQTRDLALRNHLGLDQPGLPASSRSPQESSTISPLPSPETRHATYDSLNLIGHPGPIGPPSSHHSHRQHDNRGAGTAAWNNFHAVAARREAEENEKLRTEMSAVREGQPSLQVTFNETWRQVRTGDQAGQRQVVGIARSTENNPPIPNPLSGLDHQVSTLPFAESHARPLGTVPMRSSRFFPQATENKKPTFDEGDYFRSPSPPPPEEVSNHPVYTGDSHRPLVHLPAPKPIVKLPPKVVAPPPPPPTFASMVATPRPQPVSWQEKIDTLFGKKAAPEKRTALAVTSASKEPLDVQLHIAAVSVSLPYNADNQIGDGEITAKQVEEAEEIFEDREVGSLPVVRVPTIAPIAAWQAALPPSQSRLRSKNLKSMQVHSIEPFSFGFHDKDAPGVTRISIRLPGAILAKTLTIPRKANSQTNARPRGPPTYKPRKGTKPREGSSSSSFKKTASSQQTNGSNSPRKESRNASWGPRTTNGSH